MSERDKKILALFDDGVGRNEIARTLGVAATTVTKICRENGREFDRSKQLLELRAAEVDVEELRLKLAKKMLVIADDALDDVTGPFLVYNFGGRDNTYAEHVLDSAPLDIKLNAMRTAGTAFDKATRIIERSNGGLETALGVLDNVAAALQAGAAALRSGEEDAGDGDHA